MRLSLLLYMRVTLTLMWLQLAELLLEHLDFAIAEFRDMKMQPALERALRHKEILGA